MEALATRYRPKTFEDVTGQSNVISILNNQIAAGSIKQAYAFTGGAGTGKTTCARIFASMINKGAGHPIEIDAASNNGVDSIRDLREKCKFKPLEGEYSVYIIDEVHMLSIGAFNALLKTLEEPPAHAVFILCTTDPQKIPATILSRVQRFDFKRMTHEQTMARLQYICDMEGINATPEAIDYIAKLADGGMRAGISILDTCAGYGEPEQFVLDLEDVQKALGVASTDEYFKLLSCTFTEAFEDVVDLIERLYVEGVDLKQFIKGYIDFLLSIKKYELTKNYAYVTIPLAYKERVDKIVDSGLDLNKFIRKMMDINQLVKYDASPKNMIIAELIV